MAARRSFIVIVGIAALFEGCAARSTSGPVAQQPPGSILVSSNPSSGATVREPVDALTLKFNPPARLAELVIAGAGGEMPMMVHSVAEVQDYSIPLSGLSAGAYIVNWRATARGREYRGSFSFTVRR